MIKGSHTTTRLSVHLVWITKYRYDVLVGDLKKRCRDLIQQCCENNEVRIISGVVSKDHVHLLVEYPPKVAISSLMKDIKGRTSKMLQDEFPHLQKRYWGRHFWATGYGAWSVGEKTEGFVKEYLNHHQKENEKSNFIIEKDQE